VNTAQHWPAERLELLRQLAPLPITATEIAKRMGMTRSSILGKAKRSGIKISGKPRAVAESPYTPKRKGFRLRHKAPGIKVFRDKPLPDHTLLDPKFNSTRSIALADARDGDCRWPIGSPRAMRCCGAGAEDGHYPYCFEHCRIAYQGFQV
jgi:hypothetical protein